MKRLETTIRDLKMLLPAEVFIVTGSAALSKYGLKEEEEVNDIDIILIKPTDTALEIMERMMGQCPAKTKPGKNSTSGLKAIFIRGAYKVDVFLDDSQAALEIDGIHYALPLNIVPSKKRYNRIKDWLQLRELSRLFFKQEEFETYLNNNPKFTIEYKDDEEEEEKPKKSIKKY